jgi:hypothetical protein
MLYVFSQGGPLSRIDLSTQEVTTRQVFLAIPKMALDQNLQILCIGSLSLHTNNWDVVFIDAQSFTTLGATDLGLAEQSYNVMALFTDSARGYCYVVISYNQPYASIGSIVVIETCKRQIIASLPLSGNVGSTAFSANGKYLFAYQVTSTANNILRVEFEWIPASRGRA